MLTPEKQKQMIVEAMTAQARCYEQLARFARQDSDEKVRASSEGLAQRAEECKWLAEQLLTGKIILSSA